MSGGALLESALEGELRRYLPSFPLPQYSPDAVAVSSQDPTLTALAQLGVLRLRASRCFISLFSKTHQYVIAEATPTLSLECDSVYAEGDRLWYGSASLRRHAGPCSLLVDRHYRAHNEHTQPVDAVAVIPDLSKEPEMAQTDFMKQSPVPHFYAGVALKSLRGIVVGYYGVFDNHPRSSLDAAQLQFLKDMANTVIANLANAKVREEYRQGERMIRGIASFVEGRGSLRNWRAVTGRSERAYEPSRAKLGGEGQLDQRQQALQTEEDSVYVSSTPLPEELDFQQEHQIQRPATLFRSSTQTPTNQRRDSFASTAQRRSSLDSHHVSTTGSESIATTFSRATNILRECLEVEGAIFYESNSADHSSSVQSPNHKSESSVANSDTHSSGLETEHSPTAARKDKVCPVISFSDSQQSSVNDDKSTETFMNFSERFLKSMLHRYPHGNIFHFDDRGNLSSGSSDGGTQGYSTDASSQQLETEEKIIVVEPKSSRKKKQRLRPQDGKVLLQIFPGARSIGFMPLWDSHKEKWYAGGFVWTRQANRSFTRHGHLSFLEAISSIVMADFARLNAIASERAKTDLLGSVSHELRSPLHGILGCVELLEDTPKTSFQSEMLQSIEGCGRTLLETIEQLLDFSKINNVATRRKQVQRQHSAFKSIPTAQTGGSPTRLDVIVEEVIAAVSIGLDAQRESTLQSLIDHREGAKSTINTQNRNIPAIILDIDKSMDMAFLTTPGSWRRIVMNLFANSIKYTKSGHIRLSLTAKLARLRQGAKIYRINFTITDTGQGISADYLRDKLFKPFSQEDNLASGTGLGLSIVKQIVDTCNGKIKVESVQNIGTKVSVSMYSEASLSEPLHSTEDLKVRELNETAQRSHGKTACFLNSSDVFGEFELQDSEDTLKQSLKKMCRSWFGFELCSETEFQHENSEVFLIVEPSIGKAKLDSTKIEQLAAKFNSMSNLIILVICRSLRSKRELSSVLATLLPSSCILQYLVQPFGVHKFAACLSYAFGQQPKVITEAKPNYSFGIYREKRNAVSDSALIIPRLASLDLQTQQDTPGVPEASVNEQPSTLELQFRALSQPFVKSVQKEGLKQAEETQSQKATQVEETIDEHETFLLVDDNPINLKILSTHVKRRKAPFVTAEDGLQALEIYKSNPSRCRIILMDISMPVMDGLESTRAIRSFEQQNGLKSSIIIIVTGLASAHIQDETRLSGANLYLSKPVGLKELDGIIVEFRERKGAETPS